MLGFGKFRTRSERRIQHKSRGYTQRRRSHPPNSPDLVPGEQTKGNRGNEVQRFGITQRLPDRLRGIPTILSSPEESRAKPGGRNLTRVRYPSSVFQRTPRFVYIGRHFSSRPERISEPCSSEIQQSSSDLPLRAFFSTPLLALTQHRLRGPSGPENIAFTKPRNFGPFESTNHSTRLTVTIPRLVISGNKHSI